MRIFDVISMCFRNLFRRKVRTMLTVTGVIIGTCAIIVTISLGVGMDQAQTAMIESMMDLTMVEVYNYGGMREDGTMAQKLDDSVLQDIAAQPHVVGVTPIFDVWSDQIQLYSGKYVYQGSLVGVYLDQLKNFGYELKDGTFPTAENGKQSLVFGEQAAYSFFDPKRPNKWISPQPDENGNLPAPFVDPLKDKFVMRVAKADENNNGGGKYFYGGGMAIAQEVGGVDNPDEEDEDEDTAPTKKYEYKMKGTGLMVGNYKDYYTMGAIFMDIEFAQELRDQYNKLNKIRTNPQDHQGYNNVKVRVDDMNNVEAVDAYIKSLGFETFSFETYRQPMKQQTMIIQIILGSLGGISLLVAALGIANTMVMSIYERTREIGVMKVLGCKLGNIRSIFLMEAGSIGILGGVAGVGISYLASFIMNKVLAGGILSGMLGGGMGPDGAPVQISIIPYWLVLLGLAFATFVGLASGFYPANRAVKISALEAIKHE